MSAQFLVSPNGQALLASLPTNYAQIEVFSTTERLRKLGYLPAEISAALTQIRLRNKAEVKFGEHASHLLFTADGIEQATRCEVANYHAQHLINTGSKKVFDFGCGIGADSLAFATAGLTVQAVEIDPETAIFAKHNLRNFPLAQVINADAHTLTPPSQLDSSHSDTIWIDPARRLNGKRILNPLHWLPSLEQAIHLGRHYRSAGIKIAPGIDYAHLPPNAHVTWVSYAGTLLEAVIWLGHSAPQAGRSALIFSSTTSPKLFSSAIAPNLPAPAVDPTELGAVIIEPDSALIRSGQIADICTDLACAPVSSQIAYLTPTNGVSLSTFRTKLSQSPYRDSLHLYQVAEVLPLNPKKLSKHLQNLEIGILEIKKRGIDIAPEILRKQLRLNKKSSKTATLILTPLLGQKQAVLCHPITV